MDLSVEEGKDPLPKKGAVVEEEVVKVSIFVTYGKHMLFGALLLIIAGLVAMLVLEKRKSVALTVRASKETAEIRTKMEKILSALRDEVEDQVNAIDKKPRLTDAEKKALAKLKG